MPVPFIGLAVESWMARRNARPLNHAVEEPQMTCIGLVNDGHHFPNSFSSDRHPSIG